VLLLPLWASAQVALDGGATSPTVRFSTGHIKNESDETCHKSPDSINHASVGGGEQVGKASGPAEQVGLEGYAGG
jgi:hypothetical protein